MWLRPPIPPPKLSRNSRWGPIDEDYGSITKGIAFPDGVLVKHTMSITNPKGTSKTETMTYIPGVTLVSEDGKFYDIVDKPLEDASSENTGKDE